MSGENWANFYNDQVESVREELAKMPLDERVIRLENIYEQLHLKNFFIEAKLSVLMEDLKLRREDLFTDEELDTFSKDTPE